MAGRKTRTTKGNNRVACAHTWPIAFGGTYKDHKRGVHICGLMVAHSLHKCASPGCYDEIENEG